MADREIQEQEDKGVCLYSNSLSRFSRLNLSDIHRVMFETVLV